MNGIGKHDAINNRLIPEGDAWSEELDCVILNREGFTIRYKDGREITAPVRWTQAEIGTTNDIVDIPYGCDSGKMRVVGAGFTLVFSGRHRDGT